MEKHSTETSTASSRVKTKGVRKATATRARKSKHAPTPRSMRRRPGSWGASPVRAAAETALTEAERRLAHEQLEFSALSAYCLKFLAGRLLLDVSAGREAYAKVLSDV